ncbi:MAG: restriction endonuclease subunit S [Bacteroidales bacterium]|nr:restriction endonuclease subunit S [Bacteroidales bacterium]
MKNSNIQWIGDIPDDWEVMPNKYVMCKKKDICSHYNGENILSLTMNGVIVRDLDAGGKIPATFNGYQYIHPNNLLMCLFDYDVTPRCIGLIKNEGVTSPAYSQFVLKNGNNPSYYYYYYLMLDNTKELLHLAKNLRHSFTEEQLGVIPVCVPPLATQTSIATYLDAKCSEIDGLIADINKQIETLNELKKSTITEAVTKGLNKNAKLKDSGIQWIGMIPEGWRVSRVKYLVDSITKGNGITKEQVYEDGDIDCVRYGEIYSKYNNKITTCLSKTRSNEILSPKTISYGDILCAGTGELIEEIGKNVVYLGENKSLAGGDIIIIKHKQEPSFLNYLLNSNYVQSQKGSGKLKLKVVHISGMEIGNLVIALPPLTEQRDIATYLDTKCTEFDSIISDKRKQISTLEAYKKSLIYEYVTGKKQV